MKEQEIPIQSFIIEADPNQRADIYTTLSEKGITPMQVTLFRQDSKSGQCEPARVIFEAISNIKTYDTLLAELTDLEQQSMECLPIQISQPIEPPELVPGELYTIDKN